MKLWMIGTGLVAVVLAGTAGVGLVSARTQNAEKAAPPTQDAPAAKAGRAGSAPTAIEPGQDRRSPSVSNLRSSANSPRVLWAKLNAAEQSLQMAKAAHQAARGQYDRVIAARGEVEALVAELSTSVDDLRDEVDLLQAQLEIRKADVRAAEVQLAKAVEAHKHNEKLANDKVISQGEVRIAKSEVDLRSAELAKKQAERNEIELRIKQATRRCDEAIGLAERAKALVPEREPPKAPAAPAVRQ